MYRRTLLLPLLAAATLLVAACVSPETRIRRDPDTFSKASAEQQALIKKGQIGIGFSPEFVKLAIGTPDYVTERTDASGTDTIWHYTDTSPTPASAYAYYDPMFGPPYYFPPYWLTPLPATATTSVETDRLRVTFRDGKVTTFERIVK